MTKFFARTKPAAAVLSVVLAAVAWLGGGCENGGSGNALTIEPANTMIGRNIAQFTLTITAGMRDLSQPIEWSVANPGMGRVEHRGGPTAVYYRSAQNGLQVVHARDQYGVEGTAVIEQISQDTAEPGTAAAQQVTGDTGSGTGGGTTGTTTTPPSIGGVSGNAVTVNSLWDDGSAWTASLTSGFTSQNFTDIQDAAHPGESHDLAFSSVTWSGSTITGFRVVVDGSTTLTYP